MPRFAAIEGIRAWLAWAVVFSHIAQSLGLAMHGGHFIWMERAGETSVLVFIAISGFVITGLVVEKAEPWPRYIMRRAFRIFPAYWVAYAAALFALPLGVAALPHLTWAADPAFNYDELLQGWTQTIHDHPAGQIGLHLTLLQGVVPDSVLPYSASAALGPAWSLTLEWQFYLLAPALVWVALQERYRLVLAAVVMALALAFDAHLFGTYLLRSFLPGAGYIFLIGMACRLSFDRLKAVPAGPEVIPVILGLGVLAPDFLWLAIWAVFVLYLARGDVWRTGAGRAARAIPAVMDSAFASRLAGYFGARSYSVYLLHFPIIMAMTSLIVGHAGTGPAGLSQMSDFLLLTATVIPTTLLASELLYRLVERPMIALGARLAGARARPAAQPAE